MASHSAAEKKQSGLIEAFLDHLPFREKADEIAFQSAGILTLGAEIELQIIDCQTLNICSKADTLLKAGAAIKKLKPELYQSTLEINTDKCDNVQAIEKDFLPSFHELIELGKKQDVCFATTGSHPFSRYADTVITPTPRYHDMMDRNQWLARRMTVYGLHVHIGMKSGDDCIRYNNFFLHFLPHLLALSASSPFWQGEDTGLASCRPTTYEALPTAGQPYHVRNWREFESLCETLKKCNAIRVLKDLWWDLRPSPGYGTLEIRVCDGPATLAEACAITAYIHLLAHWFSEHGSWIEQVPPPMRWLARENKWRVMRHGLEADLVTNLEGNVKPIRTDIDEWLQKLRPYIEKLGYEKYIATLRDILAKGNSSTRQRAVYAKRTLLKDVAQFNADECVAGTPLWDWEPKN
jgi:carboxylate-amine ligase